MIIACHREAVSDVRRGSAQILVRPGSAQPRVRVCVILQPVGQLHSCVARPRRCLYPQANRAHGRDIGKQSVAPSLHTHVHSMSRWRRVSKSMANYSYRATKNPRQSTPSEQQEVSTSQYSTNQVRVCGRPGASCVHQTCMNESFLFASRLVQG